MPLALVVGHVYKTIIVSVEGAQTALNVRHHVISAVTSGTPSDVDLAADLSGFWANQMIALLNGQANFYGVAVQRVNPLPVGDLQGSTVGQGVGTAGTGPFS